jgi:transposase
MNRLSTDDRCRVLACLVEGNSIRATVRITGIAKKTVSRFFMRFFKVAHYLKTRPLKLTPDKITEICQLSQAGKSISTLARQFSVSDKLIFNIIKGKVWTHIPRSVGL